VDSKPYSNARETAERYGVNERTVRRAIQDGRIRAELVGGEYQIPEQEAVAVFGDAKSLADRVAQLENEIEAMRGDIYLYGIGEITRDQLLLHLFTGQKRQVPVGDRDTDISRSFAMSERYVAQAKAAEVAIASSPGWLRDTAVPPR